MSYELRPALVDTHCHLDFPEFDLDRNEVIQRAHSLGVNHIINIGSSLEGSIRSLELTRQYPDVYAAIGVHPHEADRFDIKEEKRLRELAKEAKVLAIGEIGLDYYKNYSSADNQRLLFAKLLELARDLSLPLVIHSRNAPEDTLKFLKAAMPVKAVVHCFSQDETFLKECLDLGFFVSFTCNITYKNAQNLRELVKVTPLERLLLETDAPYLAPEGMRGDRNEPVNIKILAGEVARIKQTTLEEVARATTDNAKAFFNFK